MENEFIPKAIDIVKQAISADNAGEVRGGRRAKKERSGE